MGDNGGGLDRRVQRTQRAIRQALAELLETKAFRDVTVEDILERAGVARATFYAHYRNQGDVLVDIVRSLAADRARWAVEHEHEHSEVFTGTPLRRIFEDTAAHAAVYRAVLRGEGDGRPLREFLETTSTNAEQFFLRRASMRGEQPRIPAAVVARAWAGELVSTLAWWLEGDTGYSAAEIAELLRDLSVNGRRWASGARDSDATAAET